jgi:DNA-binding CsgD family transcriptional regulator
LNYSTVFLILLALGVGAYALRVTWRAYAAYSLDYLRFFFTRLAADLTLTMALSVLYLAGMPLYSVESWSHGNALLALLFAVGATCIFVATDAQVATVFSLASVHRRRQFTVAYAVLVVGIAGTAGIAAVIGSLQVSLTADRAMLLFAVFSRFLALCASVVLIIRYRNQRGTTVRKALLYAGCFFILTDGSWLAMYALGMMGFLHARLYDGLHLTRLLLLNGVVVVYLGRFLDVLEGTRVPGSADEQLDPYLVAKYGVSRREQEIIRHLRLGRSNEEIAERLFISTRTVKGHLYRIFQKTKVKNRVQLANLFANRGRTPSESEKPEH